MFRLSILLLLLPALAPAADNPFEKHGKLRVAKAGTHLEYRDGIPFFFLADTCWTGPALSTAADWDTYLADRKKKGVSKEGGLAPPDGNDWVQVIRTK